VSARFLVSKRGWVSRVRDFTKGGFQKSETLGGFVCRWGLGTIVSVW
jgi:hypothetical protein